MPSFDHNFTCQSYPHVIIPFGSLIELIKLQALKCPFHFQTSTTYAASNREGIGQSYAFE